MAKQPATPAPPARWLNYSEAADFLGVSTRQVHRWVEQRRIPHTKMGLRVQFTTAQLDEFLAACTFTPEASA